MIAQVTEQRLAAQYTAACAGVPGLGCVMDTRQELFGKNGGFFAGESFAVDASGGSAWACGDYDPEELDSFLRFLGKKRLRTAGPCPTGWQPDGSLLCFALQPGQRLPLGDAPAGLTLNRAPAPGKVAALLFPDAPERREDFYSELCVGRNHGRTFAWTLENDGGPVCTVGVYASRPGEAYMACGVTVPALRGQGIGGWLIAAMANELAEQGQLVTFLCEETRRRFYTRLGFSLLTEYRQYRCPETENE